MAFLADNQKFSYPFALSADCKEVYRSEQDILGLVIFGFGVNATAFDTTISWSLRPNGGSKNIYENKKNIV